MIYFSYETQVDLDECILTFLYLASQYPQEEVMGALESELKVLYAISNKHFEVLNDPNSVKKLFSTFKNLSEHAQVCSEMDISQFITCTNRLLHTHFDECKEAGIHEIAFKTLLNICRFSKGHLTEAASLPQLKSLLESIDEKYDDLAFASKAYAFRLTTYL